MRRGGKRQGIQSREHSTGDRRSRQSGVGEVGAVGAANEVPTSVSGRLGPHLCRTSKKKSPLAPPLSFRTKVIKDDVEIVRQIVRNDGPASAKIDVAVNWSRPGSKKAKLQDTNSFFAEQRGMSSAISALAKTR